MAASTPALAALQAAGVPFRELSYKAGADHFGDHAAAELGWDPAAVLKTLVVVSGRDMGMCCIPVSGKLSLKKAAAAFGWKHAEMAEPAKATRATGYVVGGISPLGGKADLPVVVDASVEGLDEACVSAGKRGLSVALAPADLVVAAGGRFVDVVAG